MSRVILFVVVLALAITVGVGGFFYVKSNMSVTTEPTPVIVETPSPYIPGTTTYTPEFLMNNLKKSPDISETITSEYGDVFTIYRYKEPREKPYCTKGVKEDCVLPSKYGDYNDYGYLCDDNPFYNEDFKEVTQTLNVGNYYLLGDSRFRIFLIKDQNNRCHPYTVNWASTTKLETLFIDPKKTYKAPIFTEFYNTCDKGDTRIVEKYEDIKEFVKDIAPESTESIRFYSLVDTFFNFEAFRNFNFIKGVDKVNTTSPLPPLFLKPYGDSQIQEQNRLYKDLALNRLLVFSKHPLIKDYLLGYINSANVYKPNCYKKPY